MQILQKLSIITASGKAEFFLYITPEQEQILIDCIS